MSRARHFVSTFLLLAVGLMGDISAQELVLESKHGYYAGTLTPESAPPPIGDVHQWHLRLSLPDGKPFMPGSLLISGGMPGHGHGFPTEPAFTQLLPDGRFVLDGVRFNMGGEWQFIVTVTGPSGLDYLSGTVTIGRTRALSTDLSDSEWALLETMTLARLNKALDPSNRFQDDATARVLGEQLFFDAALSAPGDVSCATCHQPDLLFTDGRARSRGSAELNRHSPSLIGAAHWDWFYWDGRRDSLWAQALTPLETRGEMDNNRTRIVRYALEHPIYRRALTMLLGELPDPSRWPEDAGPYNDEKTAWASMTQSDQRDVNEIFATLGKALAAYQASLTYTPSRFDEMVAARDSSRFSGPERAGLRLYLDGAKTQCLRCHNGPLFSNGGFHNIGTGTDDEGRYDFGRMLGLQAVWFDPFNCQGAFSDADPEQCTHLKFAPKTRMPANASGAFKVPSLRNVARTAPYMHDGRMKTLEEVMAFYRDPPDPEDSGHELPPLELSDEEMAQLVAFMRTL